MTNTRAARGALLGIIAIVLLGMLVFLYSRTQAIDFKRDAEILSLLRELKELDTRWDSDAARLAGARAEAPPRRIAPPPSRRILRELERAVRPARGRRRAARDQAGHGGQVRGLGSAQDPALQIGRIARRSGGRGQGAGRRVGHDAAQAIRGARRALHRARRARPPPSSRPPRDPRTASGGAFAARLATLKEAAVAADPSLARAGAPARSRPCATSSPRAPRSAAPAQKFAFLTVGGRVDLLSQTISRAVQASLDDKERWRVYLFFYAAALLIGVGYLAARVFAAQAALREANESLEKRVAERTQELSHALVKLKESEAQLVQSEKMSSLGPDGGRRGARDQHAARLREEQRGHGARPPAGAQRRGERSPSA